MNLKAPTYGSRINGSVGKIQSLKCSPTMEARSLTAHCRYKKRGLGRESLPIVVYFITPGKTAWREKSHNGNLADVIKLISVACQSESPTEFHLVCLLHLKTHLLSSLPFKIWDLGRHHLNISTKMILVCLGSSGCSWLKEFSPRCFCILATTAFSVSCWMFNIAPRTNLIQGEGGYTQGLIS